MSKVTQLVSGGAETWPGPSWLQTELATCLLEAPSLPGLIATITLVGNVGIVSPPSSYHPQEVQWGTGGKLRPREGP